MERWKQGIAVLLMLALLASFGAELALADAEAPSVEPAAVESDVPEAQEAEAQELEAAFDEQPQEPESREDELLPDEEASEGEPSEETAVEETAAAPRAWVEPGNSTVEITGGGRFLLTDDALYYSEGGVWLERDARTSYITSDDAASLNLSDGYIYYTVASGDVRRVPASGGTPETVYAFGAAIKQLYVMGQELRFLSGGSVYSYDMETDELYTLESPEGVMALIPTPLGNVFLTGEVFDYTVWAGTDRLCAGVRQCYRDGSWLVLVQNGETLQASVEGAFEGAFSAEPYSLHSDELSGNGLSDEEQLANEAAYLQSETYEEMQEALAPQLDGAYTATNSRIASTAYASSSLTTNQKNIVLRGRQMAEVKWTPLYWRYSWGGDDSSYVRNNSSWGSRVTATDGTYTLGYFAAGKTYQGVPYSQAVNTGYIGWSISIDSFVQAVNNSSSRFYSGYSYWSRTAPYYGSDCSGFVSWAWDLSQRCTCTTLLHYSTYIGRSLSSLQIGDCINNPNSHVVLVTNIGYDSNGSIVSVEITEQTPCKMRVTCYGELLPGKTYEHTGSLSYLSSYYFNGGYSIYRRSSSRSVSFTESSAVNLQESGYAAAPSISVAVNEAGDAKIVTLTHSSSSAVIRYTTDGSAPTASSTIYTGPITVTSETKLRAIAVLGAPYTGSYELTYTVSVAKAEAPFIVLLEGELQDQYVSSGSTVTAVNKAGDRIYYTTDGSVPTRQSAVMPENGIEVTQDITLRAVAVSDTALNSDPATIEVKVGTFHTVTASVTGAADGGYIAPGGAVGVLHGTDYTFKIEPFEHFVIQDVTVDGTSVGAVKSYTFHSVTGAHTISASFTVSLPFTDVSNQWFAENVAFAYSHDLFAGTTTTQFSPNAYMTRGMFITVLGRFAGYGQWDELEEWSGVLGITNGTAINIREQTNTSDTSVILGRTGGAGQFVRVLDTVSVGLDKAKWYKIQFGSVTGFVRANMNDSTAKPLLFVYEGSFADLPNGEYYTGYAQWANIYGLMSGISSTSFAPNQYIRRQDICLMFYDYLTSYCGRTISNASAGVFTDDSSISSYARDAVYAMKNIGVVNGYTDGSFHPLGFATRAEVATMFGSLYEYLYGG